MDTMERPGLGFWPGPGPGSPKMAGAGSQPGPGLDLENYNQTKFYQAFSGKVPLCLSFPPP